MTGRTRLVPMALATLLLSATSALPHASPVRISPPADSTVQNPREVSIVFSERVEAASDAIVVQDASGTRVDQGNASIGANGRIVRILLRPLSAGVYTVGWRVRSADGHTAQGKFTFRVQR